MDGKKWIFGHFTRFTRAILKSTLTRGRLELLFHKKCLNIAMENTNHERKRRYLRFNA